MPYPIPHDRAWERAVKKETRTMTGKPGAKYWTDYASYKIEAELEPERAQVSGRAEMTYHNRSPSSVRSVLVHLRQNVHKSGSLRNTFVEITGGVKIDGVEFGGEPLKSTNGRGVGYAIRGTVMSVRLPERIRSGAKGTLTIRWSYRVPKRGAPRNGHENNNLFYLGYWYPQFAVHEDVDGWVAEQYMANAEFYMGYADYDLRFTAPKGWLVRATGELENAKDVLTDTALQRLDEARKGRDIVHVIAQEDLESGKVTRPTDAEKLTWHFVAKHVRDLAVSVSNQYVWDATHAVIKDRDGPGKDGVAMIHAVYRPRMRGHRGAAEWARHTIEYMSAKVYPYQWPHMTVCEGVIGGGMEFPMMTIIGSSGGLGVTAHELIHMWFPMLVGSNEKAHAWQDEGLTSFFTTLCTAAFRKADESVAAGRRDNSMYMLMAAGGESAPCMTHGDLYPGGNAYGFTSYAKTAAILHQLRGMLGDEVFFAAMREYVTDWAFKHPYPQDLFHTFDRVAKRDLGWYFRTWFYETWTLDQAIESVQPNAEGTQLVVEDKGYATYPTEIEVTYRGGRKETLKIPVEHWLSGKRTKKLQLGKDVVGVVLDPRRITLDISRRNNVWSAE
ncbi:MAG: M1 family metallopeptidase [Planctomycetes bacterium]|nr:M1 family metallopeptidase [Planctomycetota bacterium]